MGNYPPESPETTFQRVTLAKLSAIQSGVAQILEIMTEAKPVLDVLTQTQLIGSTQKHGDDQLQTQKREER